VFLALSPLAWNSLTLNPLAWTSLAPLSLEVLSMAATVQDPNSIFLQAISHQQVTKAAQKTKTVEKEAVPVTRKESNLKE